jgi:hypothetical protein
MVLSLVMFTGGAQFALVGVLALGGLSAWPSAVASAALLGSRNAVYAIRMSPVVGRGFARRALAAHLTPVLMPGFPVLVAALVALVFGATNWLASRRPRPGEAS